MIELNKRFTSDTSALPNQLLQQWHRHLCEATKVCGLTRMTNKRRGLPGGYDVTFVVHHRS